MRKITVEHRPVVDSWQRQESGRSRDIPLGDEVLAALKAHRHLRGQLVFCTDYGRMLKKNEVKHPL